MASEDHELIEQAVAGDEFALQKLLVGRANSLSRYVSTKMPTALKDQTDAEDIVQQTFIEVCRSISRFHVDEPEKFDSWIFGIASNVIKNFTQRQMRIKRGGEFRRADGATSPTGSYVELVEILSGGHTPSHSAMGHEAVDAVRDAISSLPEDYQMAVELRLLQGKSLGETAHAMNRSERSVQGLIDRAKKRMQDALGRLSNHR